MDAVTGPRYPRSDPGDLCAIARLPSAWACAVPITTLEDRKSALPPGSARPRDAQSALQPDRERPADALVLTPKSDLQAESPQEETLTCRPTLWTTTRALMRRYRAKHDRSPRTTAPIYPPGSWIGKARAARFSPP